jgi:hypothetical protein
MPELQVEVIRARRATVAVEAARVEAVHAVAASAQETVAARERAKASIKEAEAWATIAERERSYGCALGLGHDRGKFLGLVQQGGRHQSAVGG